MGKLVNSAARLILFTLIGLCTFVRPADAAVNQATCTVSGVIMASEAAGFSAQADFFQINCSEGPVYLTYIGTPNTLAPTAGCNSSADTVKNYVATALTARVTGVPLTVFWQSNVTACPGGATGKNIIISLLY